MTVTELAPAKINLSLDILGKRNDGYHLLEMVMQSVSLYDEVQVTAVDGEEIKVKCNWQEIPVDEKNTAYCAAKLYLDELGLKNTGVKIEIMKQIPSQAGLAGGSADAAAVLRALNRLHKNKLSQQRLCELGLLVGADVPFCIQGGTKLSSGIGEVLTIAPSMPECWIVLCKPFVNVSTKEAYEQSDQKNYKKVYHTAGLLKALESGVLKEICAHMGNVFEDILQLPEITALKSKFQSCGALGSCMTGSGSVVYGIFDQKQAAQIGVEQLKQDFQDVFLCRPIN